MKDRNSCCEACGSKCFRKTTVAYFLQSGSMAESESVWLLQCLKCGSDMLAYIEDRKFFKVKVTSEEAKLRLARLPSGSEVETAVIEEDEDES